MAIVQPMLTRTIQEVRYGATGQRLICWPEVNGDLVNPEAGATVTIYNAAGGTALVSAAAATEHASYLYYDLNASNTSTFPLACDYAAEFTFVSSSLTYVKRVLFDVVLLPLLPFCPVRVDDLKNAHATIDAAITQASETTDFAGRYILPAWVEVCQWVRGQGYRPGLISDATVLYQPTLHKALQNYWNAHRQEPGDVPEQLATQHGKEYWNAIDRVVLKWDPGQSRSTETSRAAAQPRLLIGPDHLPSGDNNGGAPMTARHGPEWGAPMIVDEILDAVVDAVTGVTVTTDAGAPSQFSHLQAFEAINRSTTGDRVFMVNLNRSDPDGWRDGTGTIGIGAYYVTVDVAVRYVNEGRTSWAFEQILAQDRRKIIDGVCQYVREQAGVAGVGECLYVGGSITDSERSRAVVSAFTFRVEYQDTITRVA